MFRSFVKHMKRDCAVTDITTQPLFISTIWSEGFRSKGTDARFQRLSINRISGGASTKTIDVQSGFNDTLYVRPYHTYVVPAYFFPYQSMPSNWLRAKTYAPTETALLAPI